jgi:hypothetical protein
MDYAEYVRGISFRILQPNGNPWAFNQMARVARKVGRSLEIWNTKLPGNAQDMQHRLEDICRMPRMSTYAVAAMINAGVSRMPAGQVFVNVGVWHGFTLFAGMMKNADVACIGVDNFSQFGGPREAFHALFNYYRSSSHQFYDMDYREYFDKVHRAPIGFYIYDGEHSYQNQLEGLQIAEPFFGDGCILLVDDTNLKPPRWALEDFLAKSPNRYEVLLDRSTRTNLHPTLWNGVVVLRRVGPR